MISLSLVLWLDINLGSRGRSYGLLIPVMLTTSSLLQPLGITLLALQQRIHKHLYKVFHCRLTRMPSRARPKGTDKGDHHYQASIHHQLDDFRYTADVLHPVSVGKAQIFGQPLPDIFTGGNPSLN